MEEKHKRPNKVKIDLIGDTKELVNRSNNQIELDKNSDIMPLLLESSA
jgi:hypothetical protein